MSHITPDHVLQSCPKYAERHQLTWPQGADLATKLWGSAEDLYRMSSFVATAGLKLLPAWLSIAEEEGVPYDHYYLLCTLRMIIKTASQVFIAHLQAQYHHQMKGTISVITAIILYHL